MICSGGGGLATQVNQCRPTEDCKTWFIQARDFKYNINEFYPSISEQGLDKALAFAKGFVNMKME